MYSVMAICAVNWRTSQFDCPIWNDRVLHNSCGSMMHLPCPLRSNQGHVSLSLSHFTLLPFFCSSNSAVAPPPLRNTSRFPQHLSRRSTSSSAVTPLGNELSQAWLMVHSFPKLGRDAIFDPFTPPSFLSLLSLSVSTGNGSSLASLLHILVYARCTTQCLAEIHLVFERLTYTQGIR